MVYELISVYQEFEEADGPEIITWAHEHIFMMCLELVKVLIEEEEIEKKHRLNSR